uniref:Uncharacterized protein n=1 Tax=Candidatus Kentrum sp. LFY TaxID=2126342 RepID=A0A450WWB8_9GAMM|nr:MAG: hypothetical protein BECKLFY1418C_GA0070996_10919 [Candidatus Kentron sp. LFY]
MRNSSHWHLFDVSTTKILGNPALKFEPIPFWFWRETLTNDTSERVVAFGCVLSR